MRIIAGSSRGRMMKSPAGKDTRPTLDRIREAIFGSIQFDIADSTVLDLFAGSGAMGLESLSRGAKFATFNDYSRKSVEVVRQNIEDLGFEQKCEVLDLDYLKALEVLKQKGRKYDIVFLDPPYAAGVAEIAADKIAQTGLLNPNAKIIIEHHANQKIETSRYYSIIACKRYGDTGVTFLLGDGIN